ncbi:putative selenoprotein [Halosimplex carlsbadense 2-9-1]|uniref:Putative selenoprotein n=1 Tax=Halosimplex carlsbadense 2-9-1 TaxID=797114 RepID=M0CDF1_9EURY|nr:Rdx family protein [Halosimplex carlsbadense]ELZ20658.1 putative selenoprotein [Halosimplex carlsbadense 2-9-1]
MTTVTLTYCVPCGFRERALDTQQAILTSLEGQIDRFELVMGDHGVFRVEVGDEIVYDKERDTFDIDAIVRTVRGEL